MIFALKQKTIEYIESSDFFSQHWYQSESQQTPDMSHFITAESFVILSYKLTNKLKCILRVVQKFKFRYLIGIKVRRYFPDSRGFDEAAEKTFLDRYPSYMCGFQLLYHALNALALSLYSSLQQIDTDPIRKKKFNPAFFHYLFCKMEFPIEKSGHFVLKMKNKSRKKRIKRLTFKNMPESRLHFIF